MNVHQITRYLMKVQCDFCGEEVWPDEESAQDEAEHLIEHYDGVGDAEELNSYIERTCDGCRHFLEKDD